MRDLTEICYQPHGTADKEAPCLPVPGLVRRCPLTTLLHINPDSVVQISDHHGCALSLISTRQCECRLRQHSLSAGDSTSITIRRRPLTPTHSATPLVGLLRLRLRRRRLHRTRQQKALLSTRHYLQVWVSVTIHGCTYATILFLLQIDERNHASTRGLRLASLGALRRLVPGELTRAPERCMSQVQLE